MKQATKRLSLRIFSLELQMTFGGKDRKAAFSKLFLKYLVFKIRLCYSKKDQEIKYLAAFAGRIVLLQKCLIYHRREYAVPEADTFRE